MKAMIVGDIHLSDRPPSIRTETYATDILDKVAFSVDEANRRGCDALLLLGDVFHLKTPSKTSHALVQSTAEVLETFTGGPVLIVPGNHDMSHDRIESLESQPLGSLALSPNIHLLMGYDRDTGIFGIPYLNDWTQPLDRWLSLAAKINPQPVLVAMHAPIFPPAEDPPYDYINANDLGISMHDDHRLWPAPVAYGHIHDPHGFYQSGGMNQRWFCNNGAISRGSLHEQTVKREPKITLFDSELLADPDQCPFTSIPVPYRPAAEVFRLEEHHAEQAAEQRLDDFLARVEDVNLTALNLEEVVAWSGRTGLSEAAQAELVEIVTEAIHQ